MMVRFLFNYKVETLGNTLIITSKIKVASQNYPKDIILFLNRYGRPFRKQKPGDQPGEN
jgi:hypothetical protein